MRKTGKYRKMTDEKAEAIFALIVKGHTIKDACVRADVPYRTFYRYRQTHPDFAKRIENRPSKAPETQKVIPAVDKKVVDVLVAMESGQINHMAACKQTGVTVASFYQALNDHPLLLDRYQAINNMIHIMLVDHARMKALDPDADTALLKFVVSASSHALPEDSKMPRMVDRKDIKADVETNAPIIDIINFNG